MALHPQTHPGQAFPRWLEFIVAGVIGAAILLGGLLVAGHTDILPSIGTTPAAPAQLPYTQAD